MLTIRKEETRDIEAIDQVTRAAFENHPISHQTEHFIIRALRAANGLTLSLVAEIDDRIVGHIAFSPVHILDGTKGWYGIGPLSVLPELQKQGIGSALMRTGMELLRELGAQGCILAGDPNYYRRFGFRNIPGLTHKLVPEEVFLALPFTDTIPAGSVDFHEAFLAQE